MTRRLCQFSCGAASAVATKLTLADYPRDQVVIVNAFIQEEDEDNRRFLADCERWFDHPITVLRDEKYGASTIEVWRRNRFIKQMNYAKCSDWLKRRLLASVALPDDVKVLGYTAEEEGRLDNIVDRFPEESFEAPLIERGISKADCLAIIDRAGIELPRMYRLGFDNANCIGCPKGGENYWKKVRNVFPERFYQIAAIQKGIGPGANFLQFRSGPRKSERMSLLELPEGEGNMAEEASFECSFFCQMAEQDIENGVG